MARTLWRASALAFVLLLQSCGGGGNSQPEPAAPAAPPTAQVTLQPRTKVLSQAQLGSVASESPAGIAFTKDPGVAAGDIVVTTKTALKVQSVSAPDATGVVQVTGVTPELEEVVSSLKIDIKDLPLTPDMFVPAEKVTVAAGPRATAQRADRVTPQASTVLTATLNTQLAPGLSGEFELSLSPTVTYNIDSDSVRGTASVSGTLSAKPRLVFSKAVALPELKISLGDYRVPIAAPPLPPGFVGLRIPYYVRVKTTVGELKASLGVSGQADHGVRLTVRPTDLDLDIIGNGLSFGSTDRFTSMEVNSQATLDVRFVTGISLTALFGLTEPLSGLASAGAEGTYTYRKLGDIKNPFAPIDMTCLEATVNAVSDFSVNAKFFGLKASKVTVGIKKELYKSDPGPECSTATFTGPITLSGPASIGNQCFGTYTVSGMATVKTGPNPTMLFTGAEHYDLSCAKWSHPIDGPLPLIPGGIPGTYTINVTSPFTCPAPCVSGFGAVTGNLNVVAPAPGLSSGGVSGTMRWLSVNQTPLRADAQGTVSLPFAPDE